MFERIKRAFFRDAKDSADEAAPNSQLSHGPVSEWAATRGFGFSVDGTGHGVALEGKVQGRPWRLQMGAPSRMYIRGEEVRIRAELGIDDDAAVLVINRPLREALEKQAYSMYTDSLQTQADPSLPEEMRWLAMFDEVGWDTLPRTFWDRYSVLTDKRQNALAWVDPALADLLMLWPEPGPSAEVPFMMLLLRGKAYLRMEYTPPRLATLQHAALIFTSACESAIAGLSGDKASRPG
ncbi:MAG: hypothetical protein ABIR26_18780 [Ramlibacter sp.]